MYLYTVQRTVQTATDDLLLLADETFFVAPPPPGANRVVTDELVMHVPESRSVPFTGAGRIRASDAGRVLETVRTALQRAERDWATWWVSDRTTPAGLADRLEAEGAVPLSEPGGIEPVYTAMTLSDRPGDGPADVVARQVASAGEYITAAEILHEETGVTDDLREKMATGFEQIHRTGIRTTYLAWIDGEPVGMAAMAIVPQGAALVGSHTRADARGRGVYTALIAARWHDAVAAGARGLAVQGGSLSRPVLERVGFCPVGTVRVLIDRFA